MIMTVEELKSFIKTEEDDRTLRAKLSAIELLIRKYTNNNFQKRNFMAVCNIIDNVLKPIDSKLFNQGDTIQISESAYNDGLYVVDALESASMTLNHADLIDESRVLVTKVVYPDDIKMGVVNMIKWDLENRDKVGVQSETISRHSVTYFNMDGDNSIIGYPKSLVGFLKPYKKARF